MREIRLKICPVKQGHIFTALRRRSKGSFVSCTCDTLSMQVSLLADGARAAINPTPLPVCWRRARVGRKWKGTKRKK
jgi:hypothetical protein